MLLSRKIAVGSPGSNLNSANMMVRMHNTVTTNSPTRRSAAKSRCVMYGGRSSAEHFEAAPCVAVLANLLHTLAEIRIGRGRIAQPAAVRPGIARRLQDVARLTEIVRRDRRQVGVVPRIARHQERIRTGQFTRTFPHHLDQELSIDRVVPPLD